MAGGGGVGEGGGARWGVGREGGRGGLSGRGVGAGWGLVNEAAMGEYVCETKNIMNIINVCCEDSPTEGLFGFCQFDDLDLHTRSQLLFR